MLTDDSLQDLENYFASALSPLLNAYFAALSVHASLLRDETAEDPTIFFISREGQFLSRAFDVFCKARELSLKSRPLIASRTLLTKLVFSDSVAGLAENFVYEGSLSGFFETRLSITSEQLDQIGIPAAISAGHLSLPRDAAWLAHIIANHAPGFQDFVLKRRDAYGLYLRESGYFTGSRLIADVGYSGTIQTLLGRITGLPSDGYYCIGADALTGMQSSLVGRRDALFPKQGRFGEGNPLLDSTLIFEVLMSADYGQVDDIAPIGWAPGYRFEFGPKSSTQHLFPLLALGQEAVCREVERSADIDMADLLSADYREQVRSLLFTLLSHRQMAPAVIQEISQLDDRMGGEGFMNPWTALPPLRRRVQKADVST
jgi:hypothetical protein